MRLLFTMDAKDYDLHGDTFIRPSARAIIFRGPQLLMVHSPKYDYYKFPGGGIENGESYRNTLLREAAEEAGVRIAPESIREYGYVHRIEKSDEGGIFIQENYYYFCQTMGAPVARNLDAYEAEALFTPVLVDPQTAIDVNRTHPHGTADRNMLEREARVLELLFREMPQTFC